MTAVQTGTVACVVDDNPQYHLQALRWFATLTRCAGVAASNLSVFNAGARPESDVLRHLAQRGVRVERVLPFDERSPHCNKIRGLAAASQGALGTVVLSDCDLAFVGDPRRLLRDRKSLHAKIVDAPNPPLSILTDVLGARGFSPGAVEPLPLCPGDSTFRGNANGGLYVVHASLARSLAEAWAHEAKWLLARLHLLRQWAVHADQVSMLLALRAGQWGFAPLPLGANTPTHAESIRSVASPLLEPLVGIHYHDQVTPQGLLLPTGHPHLDRAIDAANRAVRDEFKEFFPNATFWTWRYARNPELGSGMGSRDSSLRAKRDLIALMAAAVAPVCTLDVGCGDCAAVSEISLGRYLGLDIAENAGGLLTDGKRVLCRSIESTDRADLALCLDVGIHQSDRQAWEDLMTHVVLSARRLALVSGYESDPGRDSSMVHFHEPLSALLERRAADHWKLQVAENQGVITWAVLREPELRQVRSLPRHALASMPHDCILGRELAALLACAWRTERDFPDHPPRVWEYPAVLRLLRDHCRPGQAILEVGAENSPLGPLLSALGYGVDSLSGISRDIRAYRGCLSTAPSVHTFDAVVSVGVMQQLSAGERRALLEEVRRRCHPAAWLFLTTEIAAGGPDVWDPSSELSRAGFGLQEACRASPGAGVDVELVTARPILGAAAV
jgi:hypothetical protein